DRVVAELLKPEAALGHSNHRHVEHAPLDQPHQGRKRLKLSQVTGGTEDHQRVNVVTAHLCPLHSLPSTRGPQHGALDAGPSTRGPRHGPRWPRPRPPSCRTPFPPSSWGI